MSAAHYKDLREVYAKGMEYHGNGFGLLQPVSTYDLRPPCVGYVDSNGDWTLIANLAADPAAAHPDYTPLAYPPLRVSEVDIEWQPKTALGVTANSVDASAATPEGLPAGVGANAHVRYATGGKFGAVLMTLKPVRLHAYNDGRLFRSWLDANRGALALLHGPELRRCGLWLVTRTHSARGASINKANNSALVSVKAKAAMLGELGQKLDLSDQMFDKDWCHYRAKGPDEGVVLFMDGIFEPPSRWYLESLRQLFRRAPLPPAERRPGEPHAHRAIPIPAQEDLALPGGRMSVGTADKWGDNVEKGQLNGMPKQGPGAPPRRASNQRQQQGPPSTQVNEYGEDLDVLHDAGVIQFGRAAARAASLRRSSGTGSARSQSVRCERRSVANSNDEPQRPKENDEENVQSSFEAKNMEQTTNAV